MRWWKLCFRELLGKEFLLLEEMCGNNRSSAQSFLYVFSSLGDRVDLLVFSWGNGVS